MNAVDAAISVIHICKKSPNRNIVKSANTDVKYISLAPTVLVSTISYFWIVIILLPRLESAVSTVGLTGSGIFFSPDYAKRCGSEKTYQVWWLACHREDRLSWCRGGCSPCACPSPSCSQRSCSSQGTRTASASTSPSGEPSRLKEILKNYKKVLKILVVIRTIGILSSRIL